MSKAKETVDELRKKLFNRKQDEVIQEAQKTIEATLDNTTYDIIQNPNTKSRSFLIVKIKYDLDTKQAVVLEVREFQDKVAGMSMIMDKENRKTLFERNRGEK